MRHNLLLSVAPPGGGFSPLLFHQLSVYFSCLERCPPTTATLHVDSICSHCLFFLNFSCAICGTDVDVATSQQTSSPRLPPDLSHQLWLIQHSPSAGCHCPPVPLHVLLGVRSLPRLMSTKVKSKVLWKS